MGVERKKLDVATTGSAGSATGSGILVVPPCELLAVYFDFKALPSTTDTVLKAIGGPDAADVTALTLTNVNTDAWYYPKVQNHDNAGAAITGDYSHPVIPNNLLVDIAQGDALSPAMTITFVVRV